MKKRAISSINRYDRSGTDRYTSNPKQKSGEEQHADSEIAGYKNGLSDNHFQADNSELNLEERVPTACRIS